MRRKGLLMALAVVLIGMAVPRVEAATKGLALSPAITEIRLEEGQREASFKISLSNSTDLPMNLRLSTLDFGALDEAGGIAFLGRSGQETTVYGLRQWMLLEKQSLTLEPGQSQEVKVTIENKQSLAPGGHYGAVVVSGADAEPGQDNVAVVPAGSALVLLKKSGGEIIDLNLDSVNANRNWFRLPDQATLRFQNSGNTHAVPRGTLELSGPTGAVIARGTVNTTSSFVLPESFRQITSGMRSVGTPWLPGRYTLTVAWRHDGEEAFATSTYHYWYIGRAAVITLLTVGLVFVLIMYIRYKRRPPTRSD